MTENIQRGDRLQQLIDDIVHLQIEITNSANHMEKADARMTPSLERMLADNQLPSVSSLFEKVAPQLPGDMSKQYLKVSPCLRDGRSLCGVIEPQLLR
jgi:hypothetical protein